MPGPRNRAKKYPTVVPGVVQYFEIGERGEDRPSPNVRTDLIFCERCGEAIDKGQEDTICWDQFVDRCLTP